MPDGRLRLKTGAKIEDPALNRRAAHLADRYGLPGGAGSDAHDPDGIGAAYLEMPDFDGPREFLAALAQAEIAGEHRPHAVCYARRPAAPGQLQPLALEFTIETPTTLGKGPAPSGASVDLRTARVSLQHG
ncbi:MAG TPA: PHP-associated domain-containing protein [Streptosporangiaceae bacterium]